jgi:hypothetical protein
MKKLIVLLIVAAFSVSAVWVIAQEGEKEATEEEKMMELMMKYGRPGENHKKLESAIGEWDLVSTWWSQPGAEPEESKATAKAEWILNGNFVQETVTGMMGDQPFTGFSIIGYDNFREEYVSIWIDEMSTGFYLSRGTCSEDGKVFTSYGNWDDYFTGEKDMKMKMVDTVIDTDHHESKTYKIMPDGSEFLSFQINYTRKK